MQKREQRLRAIRELIQKYPIEDQVELVDKLQKLYGIDTTQSIISRDLRVLNIGKRNDQGRMVYDVLDKEAHSDILRNAIVDITYNETLIVIKTMPALADFTAEYIDQQELAEVLGTIAGENTVFVIPASVTRIKKLYELICQKLFFKIRDEVL
ncbi:hypothetical protein KJZ61_01190 [Candidatus Dependentiae bacterium]|nr:hypothetical protein [Candidatus Dependentiae bacterium]